MQETNLEKTFMIFESLDPVISIKHHNQASRQRVYHQLAAVLLSIYETALCILIFTPSAGDSVKLRAFLKGPVISKASILSYLCNSLTNTKLASFNAYCSATPISAHPLNHQELLTAKTDPRTPREPDKLPTELPTVPSRRPEVV